MLVRLSRAHVLSGGLRRKTQIFFGTLYMAASSKTPPHQFEGPQKFKTPLQVPVFPGSSPLCHHTETTPANSFEKCLVSAASGAHMASLHNTESTEREKAGIREGGRNARGKRSVMSCRKQRSAFDHVSEFDRGRIVTYRDYG
ncbi:hypothetical protein TNCV_2579161 [Trichonephila clavipes]|uniref:Uncharacterized protein n=1 Tax=Trichonephila clavipes TaxID=2585209 RepID=A0A8X6VHV1_TRICX|nr:hypothetical protein TNCV_2579161 [Trichonephila clavipes]